MDNTRLRPLGLRFRPAIALMLVVLVWPPSALGWSWPVEGSVLAGFRNAGDPYAGGQHRGIDVGAPAGAVVLAPAAGRVSFAGTLPGHGRTVTITTVDGYAVTLIHLGAIGVAGGQDVAEGEPVGAVGPSGQPEHAQPYVHLGVRLAGRADAYIDPLGLLPGRPSGSGTAPVSPPAPEVPSASPAAAPADPEPVAAPAGAVPDAAGAPAVEQGNPVVPAPAATAMPAPPPPPPAAPAAPQAGDAEGLEPGTAAPGSAIEAGGPDRDRAREAGGPETRSAGTGAALPGSSSVAPGTGEPAPARGTRAKLRSGGPRARAAGGERAQAPAVSERSRSGQPPAVEAGAAIAAAGEAGMGGPAPRLVAAGLGVVLAACLLAGRRPAGAARPAPAAPPPPGPDRQERAAAIASAPAPRASACSAGSRRAPLAGAPGLRTRRGPWRGNPMIGLDDLLRDDADLLRQLDAAHRPRIHDDRGRRARAAPPPAR
ncbi:MAG: M23 family metallopeptidase [Thermoleophilia bacterium]|nr:M23 family metallopeptidase [Thermoleophilia bacterium]